MCSSQLPFTRFRAIVKTTCDGSRPLLTGAWESLSHRCRLPVQQGSSTDIAEVEWLVDVKYLFVCFLEIDL